MRVLLDDQELEEYSKIWAWSLQQADENAHQSLLRGYWEGCFPEREVPSLPSDPRWVEAGFQSARPFNDFRGGGLLSLMLINYLAAKHPKALRNIVQSKDRYPFAASFINIEFALVKYLRLDSDLGEHLRRLHEVQERQRTAMPLRQPLIPHDADSRNPLKKRSIKRANQIVGSKTALKRMGILLTTARTDPDYSLDGVNPTFGNIFVYACVRMHNEWIQRCATQNLLAFGAVFDAVMKAVNKTLSSDKALHSEEWLRRSLLGE